MLQLQLPYFDNATFASIAKARKNEASFEEFRSAINKAFREIEAAPNSSQYQALVDEVIQDLLSAPLAKIESRMKSLNRNLFLDAAILFGSLTSTIITQGNTLVGAAALLAITKAFEMYSKDKATEEMIKEMPSFFYWEAIRNKK